MDLGNDAADRHHIAPKCGGCGADRLLMTTSDGCRYGICEDCKRVQEVETRANPAAHLCDNCAFRPGSGERTDPWRWMQIKEATIEGDQTFYCHKGMDSELRDHHLAYLPGDLDTLQPCAGWLAHRMAWLARQATNA